MKYLSSNTWNGERAFLLWPVCLLLIRLIPISSADIRTSNWEVVSRIKYHKDSHKFEQNDAANNKIDAAFGTKLLASYINTINYNTYIESKCFCIERRYFHISFLPDIATAFNGPHRCDVSSSPSVFLHKSCKLEEAPHITNASRDISHNRTKYQTCDSLSFPSLCSYFKLRASKCCYQIRRILF